MEEMSHMHHCIKSTSKFYGLCLIIQKPKVFVIGDVDSEVKQLTVDKDVVESVKGFIILVHKYTLMVKVVWTPEGELQCQNTVKSLDKIWQNHIFLIKSKNYVMENPIFLLVLCFSKSWTLKAMDRKAIDSSEMWAWQRLF